MDRDSKISSFKMKLKTAFVDNYDDINKAKDIINNKLKESNVNYSYDYNTFCVELLKEGVEIASKVEDIENIVLVNFLYIILSNMVTNKLK